MSLALTDKTVTVIVPVFNAAGTLNRCVESVINQTIDDWRLLLIDDGSEDESLKICKKFESMDPRISCLSKENSGVGAARNLGIDRAQTRWITFVDSDDSIEPTYLENFIGTEDLEGSIVLQGYRRVDTYFRSLGEKVSFSPAVYEGDGFMENAFKNSDVYHYGQAVGKLYDIELINDNSLRFTKDFSFSEDHLFFLSYLLYVKRIITREGELYNYIYENDALTLSQRQYPFETLFKRYESILDISDKIVKRYSIGDDEVSKMIDHFAVTGSISLCLRSIYSSNLKKQVRIGFLKKILRNKEMLRKRFNPRNFSGRMLKKCMLLLPSWILDELMKLNI